MESLYSDRSRLFRLKRLLIVSKVSRLVLGQGEAIGIFYFPSDSVCSSPRLPAHRYSTYQTHLKETLPQRGCLPVKTPRFVSSCTTH